MRNNAGEYERETGKRISIPITVRWVMDGNTKDIIEEDVPLLEFMYLVFTRMSGESYRI